MDIEAIVFDLDGTAIQKDPSALPSQRVIGAVQKAKTKCHVSIATGRPLALCKNILDILKIEDLCILNGGSHLYSNKTKEYLWKQEVETSLIAQIFKKLEKYDYQVADEKWLEKIPLKNYHPKESVALCCIFAVTEVDVEPILKIVRNFNGVAAHSMSSWTPKHYDIHVTHELATKKHALQSLAAHINVPLERVMVVGDGGNDLPLFEVAGLKIAMGNSDKSLLEKADWIAPSVIDDGLATAIEKYILG